MPKNEALVSRDATTSMRADTAALCFSPPNRTQKTPGGTENVSPTLNPTRKTKVATTSRSLVVEHWPEIAELDKYDNPKEETTPKLFMVMPAHVFLTGAIC